MNILIFPCEWLERHWKSLSNIGQHRDNSTVPEFSATLITLQHSPSFPVNSGFHMMYLSQKVKGSRANHPNRSHPIFQMGKQSQGEKVTCLRSGTSLWPEEFGGKLLSSLPGPGTNYPSPKNRSWLLLASTSHLKECGCYIVLYMSKVIPISPLISQMGNQALFFSPAFWLWTSIPHFSN